MNIFIKSANLRKKIDNIKSIQHRLQIFIKSKVRNGVKKKLFKKTKKKQTLIAIN